MSDEIQPYVVYRLDGDQMECALWQINNGAKALALFLSGDTATSFRQFTNLGAEWRIFRPAKEALLQLLKACCQDGISFAVLDPDLEKAQRIFNIPAILKAVDEEPSP